MVRDNADLFSGELIPAMMHHLRVAISEGKEGLVLGMLDAMGKVKKAEPLEQELCDHEKMWQLQKLAGEVEELLGKQRSASPEEDVDAHLVWLETEKKLCTKLMSAVKSAPDENSAAGQHLSNVVQGAQNCVDAVTELAKGAVTRKMQEHIEKLEPVSGGLADGKSWKDGLDKKANFPDTLAAGKILVSDPVDLQSRFKMAHKDRTVWHVWELGTVKFKCFHGPSTAFLAECATHAHC